MTSAQQPQRVVCALCPDQALGFDLDELQRWAVWHVYWCHIDAWESIIGRRTPAVARPTAGSIFTTAEPGTRGQLPAPRALPQHRTEAGWPRCSTCEGGGCPDCTDPA